jgi:hypothetical protein
MLTECSNYLEPGSGQKQEKIEEIRSFDRIIRGNILKI